MANTLHFNNDGCSWLAPVARWSEWDASIQQSDIPSLSDLHFIDPMQRRRLSHLAKMSLKVAHDCAANLPSVSFVYASRHGELNRTTAMLNDLAADDALSPTAFGLSVLNASAGLFSIMRHDTAPATAVTAGAESFGYGLLEACMQFASNPQQPVLFVYADEPLPSVYGRVAPDERHSHAVAILLRDTSPTTLTCTWTPPQAAISGQTQAHAFLSCLATGHSLSSWHGSGKSWFWRR